MTLIKSISGIRGTIGGPAGEGLTPLDVVKYTAAYAFTRKRNRQICRIVIGRDARISGEMVERLVISTLQSMGVDVISLGLSTTPTVEMAVKEMHADGGIILTASHNPKQWNALKLLNEKGEFISAAEGEELLKIADSGSVEFSDVSQLGKLSYDHEFSQKHIDLILQDELVDTSAMTSRKLKIVVDGINSTGSTIVPQLLASMGIHDVVVINADPTGDFAHNPEPLPEHLVELSAEVIKHKADMGIVVDPDVDRLAFVCEDGTMFGEEYTLVAVADYVLSKRPGNTVSNLSSTRALRDVTRARGGEYFAAAVGEVNVVEKMKEVNAVIGGEGNGGVIYPPLHYGRDALAGIALFLTHFSRLNVSMTQLRASLPNYFMSKNKVDLDASTNVDKILEGTRNCYLNEEVNTIDGVKIDFSNGWVHLRKSNTEPIIRIYAEGDSEAEAARLAGDVMKKINEISS